MIDEVRMNATAGAGGKGCVSFRREKFVPRGGPDGGDGGKGGDVVLIADSSVNTLREVGRGRGYRARSGDGGKGNGKHGRRGQDVRILVPAGTQVWEGAEGEPREFVGDLVAVGQELVIAEGGRGGWGNARFRTSTYQAPRIAQRGQKGVDRQLLLELKLLADVGIVGLPNAGKSSLLTHVSHARPRVADYPFTTLAPSLGVVDNGYRPFTMADIPGLIEGAHRGAGLGLDFLRHVERTEVIVHLLDGSRPNPLADMAVIYNELVRYSRELGERERVVAVNKIDLPEVRVRIPALRSELEGEGIRPLFVSAATGEGTPELVEHLAAAIDRRRQAAPPAHPALYSGVRREPPARRFSVAAEAEGTFRVEGKDVVAFAEMMPLESAEGVAVFWRRLGALGVTAALRRAGAPARRQGPLR